MLRSVGKRRGKELDRGEEGAVATDREEIVEVGDTVAFMDDGYGDIAMLQFGNECLERRSVNGVDITVI